MNDPKKITFNFTDQSLVQIERISKALGTTPANTISQALALFTMIQGKRVIIKDDKQNKDLVIDTYANSPAQNEG